MQSIKIKAFMIIFIFSSFILSDACLSQSVVETDEIEFVVISNYDTGSTFTPETLNKLILSTEGKKNSTRRINKDEKRLRQYCKDNGFFEADVEKKIDTIKNIVTFTIILNKWYRVENIYYTNLPHTLIKKIEKIDIVKAKYYNFYITDSSRLIPLSITQDTLSYYKKDKVVAQTHAIIDLLQNNGYMNACLRNDTGTVINIDTTNKKVNVILNFDSTHVKYKFATPEFFIPNNIDNGLYSLVEGVVTFKEGELFSKDKMQASKYNIDNIPIVQTNSFDSLITIYNSPDYRVVRPINSITLNKRDELSVFIKGLHTDRNGNYFGAGFNYLSRYLFFGRGLTYSAELDALHDSHNLYMFTLSSTVQAPYFYDINKSISDKITAGIYKEEEFKYRSISNSLRITTKHPECWINSTSFGFTDEFVWLDKPTNEIARGIVTPRNNNLYYNSFFDFTLNHDTTGNIDRSLNYSYSFTAGYAGALPFLLNKLGKLDLTYSRYLKLNVTLKDFVKLGETSVLASCVKAGTIIEFKGDTNVISPYPIYKFISGGSSSLRGWYFGQNGNVPYTLNGGDFLLEANVEFRGKFSPSSKKSLGYAFFTDFGNIWETIDKLNLSLAMDIGCGLRYNLLSIPLRFDIGIQIIDPNNQKRAGFFNNVSLHFAINEAF